MGACFFLIASDFLSADHSGGRAALNGSEGCAMGLRIESCATKAAAAGRRQPCATGAGHSGGKAALNGSELCAAEAENEPKSATAAQEQGRQG